MELTFHIALVFGAIFGLGLVITIILWFKFFSIIKRVDPELHERLRFRLKPSLSKGYGSFIFKKEFEDYPNQEIYSLSKITLLGWTCSPVGI